MHTFQIGGLVDLEHAFYILNFERTLLGLSAAGELSVYYRYPCRFLDRSNADNYLCSIHESALQPRICAHYNPYSCWYKPAFSGSNDEFLPIDRRRLEALADLLVFDGRRALVESPDWSELVELVAKIALDPEYGAPPDSDPVFDQWLEEAALGIESRTPSVRRGYHDFADPCTGCAAYCCNALIFPQARPTTRKNLDYLQFALGFPGIEVGVSDGDWMLIVRTRCRHLTGDNRCGIFGQPERPNLCRYYDATACSYVAQFGSARPRGFMRIRLEQFFWMAEACTFDDSGVIVDLPPVDELRDLVESRWSKEVYAAAQAAGGDVGADDPGASSEHGAPSSADIPDVAATELVRSAAQNEPDGKTVDD